MKIVFVDLDGTFLDRNKKIPKLNMDLLNKLHDIGILVVPATGRSLTGIPDELKNHPSVNYAICSNGAVIYDIKNHQVLKENSLKKEVVLDLYKQLEHFDIQFDLFADNQIFSERIRLDRLNEFKLDQATHQYVMSVRIPIDESMVDFIKQCERIERTNFFYKNEQDKLAIMDIVGKNKKLICLSSLPTNLEVMSKEVHKGNGVAWLLDYLNIDLTEAVAFGDSNNDLSMLEVVGNGVAMKNACMECKAVSNHICESNDDAGVALYLEELFKEI